MQSDVRPSEERPARSVVGVGREDRIAPEGDLRMGLHAADEDAMVRVAVADLGGRFASIDGSHIEVTVRRHIREWSSHARVKTYVGIIAQRHARMELQANLDSDATIRVAGNAL